MARKSKKLVKEESMTPQSKTEILANLESEYKIIKKKISLLKKEIKAEEEALLQQRCILLGRFIEDKVDIFSSIVESEEFKNFLKTEDAANIFNENDLDTPPRLKP